LWKALSFLKSTVYLPFLTSCFLQKHELPSLLILVQVDSELKGGLSKDSAFHNNQNYCTGTGTTEKKVDQDKKYRCVFPFYVFDPWFFVIKKQYLDLNRIYSDSDPVKPSGFFRIQYTGF
jgi:hypothetical protein